MYLWNISTSLLLSNYVYSSPVISSPCLLYLLTSYFTWTVYGEPWVCEYFHISLLSFPCIFFCHTATNFVYTLPFLPCTQGTLTTGSRSGVHRLATIHIYPDVSYERLHFDASSPEPVLIQIGTWKWPRCAQTSNKYRAWWPYSSQPSLHSQSIQHHIYNLLSQQVPTESVQGASLWTPNE